MSEYISTEPKTVCIQCKWCSVEADHDPGTCRVRYHYRCEHGGPKTHWSTLTGHEEYVEPPYCRDVNDGDCEKFEAVRVRLPVFDEDTNSASSTLIESHDSWHDTYDPPLGNY